MKSKICGISDSNTLKHLTNHPHPPHFVGFIVNYPKSRRFVEHNKLKKLLKIDKRNSKYVAVLVKPNKNILEKINKLPFVIGRPIIRQSLPALIASLAFIVLFCSFLLSFILIPGVKHLRLGAISLIILVSNGLQMTPYKFASNAILISLLT